MTDTDKVLEYVKKLNAGDLTYPSVMEWELQIPIKTIYKILIGRIACEGLVRWQYQVVQPVDSPYLGRLYDYLTEIPSDVVSLPDVVVIFKRVEE